MPVAVRNLLDMLTILITKSRASALLERREAAVEWLERSVGTGFACWPFFLEDHCLQNSRGLSEFEVLVSSLQAKYPDHLGLLFPRRG